MLHSPLIIFFLAIDDNKYLKLINGDVKTTTKKDMSLFVSIPHIVVTVPILDMDFLSRIQWSLG
jgi:hypothetical protein